MIQRTLRIASLSWLSVESSTNRTVVKRSTQYPILLGCGMLLVTLAQQTAAAQQPWSQGQQYQNSQYVQANPNYVQYQQPQQQAYGQQQYPQQQQYAQQQQPEYADPGQDDQPAAYGSQQPTGQAFGAQQLEQLVAPIALYPDSLVAQILAASTYPAQVVAADNWLHSQAFTSPDQVAFGADAQTNWDPSVKGLTAFPVVLDLMNRDLRWTTDLGNAYYNQPQDVLQTIQVMRERAQNAGTLQSTPQQAVSYNQGYIQLTPASSQVVYVPTYNPWTSYGQPVSPYPGFSLVGALQSFADSGLLQYGLSFATSAFNNTPFGIAGWALNWLTSSIFFRQSPYSSQSTSVSHWGDGGGGYYGSHGGGINRTPRGFGGSQQGGINRRPNGFGGSQAEMNRFGNQGRGPVRPLEPPNRGFAGSYARPALPQYRVNPTQQQPIMPVRPQPQNYGRSNGYGYGSNEREAWRAPASTYQRNDFAQRSYAEPRSYSGGRGYSDAYARPEKSGGFRMFGGNRGGENFHSSYKEPKFKAPREFKAPKAPKMSGGGHFGGGGHGGGGGHSGHGFGHR